MVGVTARHPEQIQSSCPALAERYLSAQLAGNRAAALRLVFEEGLHAGVSMADLHLSVVQPAQREIGRLWQDNRISVAQEHLATSISQLVVAHLYEHLPREAPNGKRAVVACVQGELHDMGARIGADFLEMAGFSVQYLGADVGTEALLAAVETEQPDLVGLSAAMSFQVPSLEAAVEAIRRVRGAAFPILIGGHVCAFVPGLAHRLRLQGAGMSADELVAGCRGYFGC